MSHDQVIQWTKAKVCVYSDSVLCLGKMNESKDAIIRCEGQVEGFKMSPSYTELLRIDGEALEFEWNIFPQFRHCRFFKRSTMICESGTSNLRNSQTRSSLCQCSTTSIGQRSEMMRFVTNAQKVKGCAMRFLQGHWTFLGHRSDHMVERFKDAGHPAFKSIGRRMAGRPYISMRMLRSPSSCSESFILSNSSVLTKQFRIGVNKSA